MNFSLRVAFGEREHDKAGDEIGEEEDEERKKGVRQDDGDSGGKEPVTITDPFTLGNEVKEEIKTA